VVATASFSKSSHRGILAAAGLIAGDSLFSLLAGVLIVCQFDLGAVSATKTMPSLFSGIALSLLCILLAFTYLDGRKRTT
jgi:hypothetical protein